MQEEPKKPTMKKRLGVFLTALSKYATGAAVGALVIIALNSYQNVIKVHLAPQMETVSQERMDRLK